MLETCRGGPRPVGLCVEKTKNFDEIQTPRTCRQKWTKILIGPVSPHLKPLKKWACNTCLKLAGEALCLLGCLLKTLKILVKFNHRRPVGKMDQNLIGPFSPNLKPLKKWACPTCLKLAVKALGLLGCVLKTLKIVFKFNHRGPVGKNGPKF